MLFYKLTEIIGIDDMSLYASRCKGSRPKPTEIDPFLYFVGTREGEDF